MLFHYRRSYVRLCQADLRLDIFVRLTLWVVGCTEGYKRRHSLHIC